MRHKHPYAYFTLLLIYFAAISYTGLVLHRVQTTDLLISYFAAFFSFFWLSKFENTRFTGLFIAGIFARLILFFGLPNLSDDFYRFIWDGHMVNAGINPYALLPEHIGFGQIPGLSENVFQGLNSKNYYSIYPPLNQLIFWFSVNAGESVLHNVNSIRLILLMADIGSFFLLRSLLKNKNLVWWFFLNPLIILEITGNIHFEGLVIFFLLLTLYYLKRKKFVQSALSLGAACLSKLLPLIFLPYLAWKYRWKIGIIISVIVLALLVISFSPFITDPESVGLLSSFSLYFKKFEFNASVYFMLREIGYWSTGYNIIGELGPGLAFFSLLLILALALGMSYFKRPVSEGMLFTWSVYLFFSTTVHPWYILPLIPLGLLSGYYFPVVWSFMIFITYAGYASDPYQLPMFLVIVEYIIVFSVLFYEIWKKYRLTKHNPFYGS